MVFRAILRRQREAGRYRNFTRPKGARCSIFSCRLSGIGGFVSQLWITTGIGTGIGSPGETWRPGRGTLTLRNGIFRVVLIRLDKEKGKSEADPGGVLWSEQECRVCLAFSNMSRVKRLVGMRPQERALGLARQESGSTEDGFTRVQVVNGVHSGVRIWRRYQTGGFEAIPGGGNQKPPPTFLWHLPKQDSSPQIRHFRLQPALTLFRPGPASTGPNLRSAFDGPRSRRNSLQGQSDCVSE